MVAATVPSQRFFEHSSSAPFVVSSRWLGACIANHKGLLWDRPGKNVSCLCHQKQSFIVLLCSELTCSSFVLEKDSLFDGIIN